MSQVPNPKESSAKSRANNIARSIQKKRGGIRKEAQQKTKRTIANSLRPLIFLATMNVALSRVITSELQLCNSSLKRTKPCPEKNTPHGRDFQSCDPDLVPIKQVEAAWKKIGEEVNNGTSSIRRRNGHKPEETTPCPQEGFGKLPKGFNRARFNQTKSAYKKTHQPNSRGRGSKRNIRGTG